MKMVHLKKRRLGRGVAVIGAGLTKFGAYPEGVRSADLFTEAFLDMSSSVDKGFSDEDIDALYLGNFSSDLFEGQGHLAADVVSRLGLSPRPAVRLEAACASSGVALREAVIAIASGIYDMVLAGGVEKMTNLKTPEVTGVLGLALDPRCEMPSGETFPGIFATIASAHMAKYGTTPEDLMRVALKNHRNASLNPKAHLNFSIKDIMKRRAEQAVREGRAAPEWADEIDFLHDPAQNPYVAYPLRLFDCSTVCDGASSVLLCAESLAREFTDAPLYVIGIGEASDNPLQERPDITVLGGTPLAAREAYAMAGVSPQDIKIAEVHDCFTIAEIMGVEGLGFYAPGKAASALRNGEMEPDGRLPVNTDGGLKAKGHPVGATGTAMAVELFKQMRREAGERQIKRKDTNLGLMLNIGAHGTTAVVSIFERR